MVGWLEMAQLHEGEAPAAKRGQEALGAARLARCPRPKEAGLSSEGELKKDFSQLRKSMGMKEKASLPWAGYAKPLLPA